MSNGAIRYRLSFAGRHLQWLREHGIMPPGFDRAAVAQAFVQAVEHMQSEPLEWGDPLRDLRYMGLAMYRGHHQGILVDYAVDDVRLIVYIAHIRLAPWHPLYRPDE